MCDWVTLLYSRKLTEHCKPAIMEKNKNHILKKWLILLIWTLCLFLSFFFFFFFFFFLAALQHMEFPGQRSDPSHSCDLSHSFGNANILGSPQSQHQPGSESLGHPGHLIWRYQGSSSLGLLQWFTSFGYLNLAWVVVPIVVKWKQIGLGNMRLWVQSLASFSGLRIWHCHELWCRSQMQLRSRVAVAMV